MITLNDSHAEIGEDMWVGEEGKKACLDSVKNHAQSIKPRLVITNDKLKDISNRSLQRYLNNDVFVDIDHVQQLISELTEDEIIQIKQFCDVLLESKNEKD